MSKKLPKYKKDALMYLLKWANDQINNLNDFKLGYTKLVYSEEHASITFYPYNTNIPEMEVGLDYNVKGRVQLIRGGTGKVMGTHNISDEDVAKLTSSISQVNQKVPFNYKGEYGNERSIGFHYSTYNGVLSVRGSYNNQYMYPGS
jgi:hypothetical protein